MQEEERQYSIHGRMFFHLSVAAAKDKEFIALKAQIVQQFAQVRGIAPRCLREHRVFDGTVLSIEKQLQLEHRIGFCANQGKALRNLGVT